MKIKKLIKISFILTVTIIVYVLSVNFYVVFSQETKIVPSATAVHLKDAEYALVLGCGIKGDQPSDMLYDRLIKAVELMKKNKELTLILSGDNSGSQYNEVGVMHKFMVDNGIDDERLIDDNFGFSTGESMENYCARYADKKVIIITQPFHLYRALFISEKLGIEAYGLEAAPNRYAHEYFYSLREIAARNKDFLKYTVL